MENLWVSRSFRSLGHGLASAGQYRAEELYPLQGRSLALLMQRDPADEMEEE